MADYVVSTWDEFLQHNTSGSTVKFANPHEVNGEIVLEGDGTQNNPFVVSTYEEMLFATGAKYIWKVKLIDREQKIYRYRYISDYDEQRNPIYSEIFCKYDDSLSTIDFNDIQPNGYTSTLNIDPVLNLNGWTWKNAVFHNYGFFDFYNPVSNAIFKDFFCDNKNNTSGCCVSCRAQMSNMKMSGTFDTDGKAIFGIRSGSNSAFRGLINSSFDFKLLGKSSMFGDSGFSYTPRMENCNIHFELIDNREAAISLNNGVEVLNCLFSGNIKAPNCTHTYDNRIRLIDSGSKYSIFNINAEVEEGHNIPYLSLTGNYTPTNLNLYVNDGNVDYYIKEGSNLVGVPSATLKDAQALYNLGLPIGVD